MGGGLVRLIVFFNAIFWAALILAPTNGKTNERWVVPQSQPGKDQRALWQLQQRLFELAESKLGPRDASKKIYQPKFHADGPRVRNTPSLDGAFAELSPNAQNYWPTAVYELAHETVHLLNPRAGQRATVLEEGLAVEFSVYAQLALGLSPHLPAEGPYRDALQAVRKLPVSPFQVGLEVRKLRGSLSSARGSDLAGADPLLASELLETFQNDREATE